MTEIIRAAVAAALIVMAGLIFLCFILCACKVGKDEDERMKYGRNEDERTDKRER